LVEVGRRVTTWLLGALSGRRSARSLLGALVAALAVIGNPLKSPETDHWLS
jgi:hypothetical protein